MTQPILELRAVYNRPIGSMQLLWRIGPQFSRLFGTVGPTVAEWLLVRGDGGIVISGCEQETGKIEALKRFCDCP